MASLREKAAIAICKSEASAHGCECSDKFDHTACADMLQKVDAVLEIAAPHADEVATCLGCCVEQLQKWRPLIERDELTTSRDLERIDSAIQWATALERVIEQSRPR